MFIKSFSRLQHSSKDGALKISAFCSYKKKKRVIRGKDEGYRLPKQKSKNGMSRNCRTFQYWKELRLKYLKERQNSLKGISVFQRKL